MQTLPHTVASTRHNVELNKQGKKKKHRRRKLGMLSYAFLIDATGAN